jgi:hypothetical protein
MDQTLSYSVVPVECILNGEVLLPGPPPQIGTLPQPDACYWALLSPITSWLCLSYNKLVICLHAINAPF